MTLPVVLGMPCKIRILIADDHVTVREGLAAMLDRQTDMEIVGQATDGQDAVRLWRDTRPDVTLVDMRMPMLDGVGVILAIRGDDHNARAIVLSTFDTDTDVARAVKAGASGYLLKDAPIEDVLAGIRKVHAGSTSFSPALVAKLAANLSVASMTQRELNVLDLLARGYSNRLIAENLLIGEATVKTHLRRIFEKLDVISRTEAVSVARRRGLVEE